EMGVNDQFAPQTSRRMSASCPLYPQKRTLVERVGMSALCQKRTLAAQTAIGLLDKGTAPPSSVDRSLRYLFIERASMAFWIRSLMTAISKREPPHRREVDKRLRCLLQFNLG